MDQKELKLAVRELHQYGIKAIADIVMNQMMGSSQPELIPLMDGTSFREDGFFFDADATIAYTNFDFANATDQELGTVSIATLLGMFATSTEWK